jgi:hypothetical protein
LPTRASSTPPYPQKSMTPSSTREADAIIVRIHGI